MAEAIATKPKTLAENVPPYARQSARTGFLALWDCANFLMRGDKAEKEIALKRLENLKESYHGFKSETFCTLTPYGEDMLEYFSGEFSKHDIGKFYARIKKVYETNNKKELKKVYGELEKITKGFNEVYCPSLS